MFRGMTVGEALKGEDVKGEKKKGRIPWRWVQGGRE